MKHTKNNQVVQKTYYKTGRVEDTLEGFLGVLKTIEFLEILY
jgi:hypothetical protein